MNRSVTRFQNRAAQKAAPRAAAPPPALDDEWRRWIAENLLFGTERTAIIERLAARGCPVEIASAEIARAEASPYFRAAAVLQQRLAKRDWHLAVQAKAEAQAGLAELPREHAIDAARFHRDYYAAGRPVLLSGLIDHWPAMARWSLDHLAALPGNPQVEVQAGREKAADYEIRSTQLRATQPLSDVVARLRDPRPSNDFYLTANNTGHNRAALAPLWDEIGDLPGFLDPAADRDGFVWIGPRGTITPWHHDLTNNFLIQIVGRKRVTMVSASQTPAMRNHLHCYSLFGGDAALAAAPAESRPHALTCDLGPGEILFLPVGWWHHVEGLDVTMGASFTNFVWDNDFSSFYTTYNQV